MKNKLNKKGFTLVELLAVIVVLAIIIVIAAPQVLNAMNDAKKKSFQLEGQRVIDAAISTYTSNQLVGNPNKTCFTLADMHLTATGFTGYVVISSTTVEGRLDKNNYSLYLTDGVYEYSGATYTQVYGDTSAITTVSASGSTVSETCPTPTPGS